VDNSELHQSLGRIEGALEGILREQQHLTAHVDGLSVRLRCVEGRLSHMLGWAGAISAFAAMVVSLVIAFVKRDIW